MFIDKAKVELRAGKGGDGAISFHKEKYVDRGGPDGGNGGRGGSIILVARQSSSTLINFRHSRVIKADEGEKGDKNNRYGRKGEDVYVEVPVGTVVYDFQTHELLADLATEGQQFVAAKGGRGGRGNTCFKSPQIRVPKIAENGLPGEKKILTLELKILADVGFIGLPSVGKSTLLSVISKAKPEIADYPFTTITPNLGLVELKDGRSFVAADLPGLIEGAHLGKGLGLEFLRHIERCRVLVQVISMDGERDPYEDYLTIMDELTQYGFGLSERPMVIAASKMDEEGANERLKTLRTKLKEHEIIPISALADQGIDLLLYKVADILAVTLPFPILTKQGEEAGVKIYDANEMSLRDVFRIEKINDHTYRIFGDSVLNTYHRINLSTDEGLLKLLQYLRFIGVDDELKKMQVKDGDTVILDDFEFDYFE
ncbi:MAG TPA: GTPase ObgE [Bacilli bacterium]|nr:GTPase ObgE [Bacilli bacterium]